MKINTLTVGPIVGETTPSRVRIWGRGSVHIVDDMPLRCFGALRHREVGAPNWEAPQVFKMNPNFDLTGIGIIGGLHADTEYEYQMGCFSSSGELVDARFSASDEDWTDANGGRFRTASDDAQAQRSLAIGSCRYLLKTFLGDFFDDRGDKTFRSILRRMDNNGERIDQLIMMGDQIYADDLNSWNPDKTVAQFNKRYRDAFKQKHIRRLMARVPTYMTLDDHEIEDNWPENASDKDFKTLFPVAMHAYQAYQLSHSPNIPVRRGRLAGTPRKHWYNYSDGCCDIFVMDTRTERMLDLPSPEIVGPDQMRALKRWLNDGSGKAKIVVSSVPFFPDPSSSKNTDKWSGFIGQRDEILTHIEQNDISHVAFFSGDIHATLSCELELPSGNRILSVVSSAFFWPYPHPRGRNFQTTGALRTNTGMQIRIANTSRMIADDNFCIVTIRPWRDLYEFSVRAFERKGRNKLNKVHRI